MPQGEIDSYGAEPTSRVKELADHEVYREMSVFTCIICEQERKGAVRALGTSSINSICQSCYNDGYTVVPPSKPKGMTCPECGVFHNSPEYHRCKTPANRVAAKNQVVRHLLRRQDSRCFGCRIRFRQHYRATMPRADAYCIDHDHKTGKIRGLLCHDCNYFLGVARDDPKRLRDESFVFAKPYDEVHITIRRRLATYLEGEGTDVLYDPWAVA